MRAFANCSPGCSGGGWALAGTRSHSCPPRSWQRVLFALSLTSPIFSADGKAVVLLSGILAGLTTVLEEVGWTGFAVPRLRLRYGVITTGLIVGVLWGAWHLLQGLWISGTYSGALPLALFVTKEISSFVLPQVARTGKCAVLQAARNPENASG